MIYTIGFLREAKNLPSDFATTLLGIMFSSGNGVVGVFFFYIADVMPFRDEAPMRLAIFLSYTGLSLTNMFFSLYLTFGTVVFRTDEEVQKNGREGHMPNI